MLFEKLSAGGNDVLRFGSVEADAVDVLGQAVFAEGEHGLRRWRVGKQLSRGDVDAFVCGLRGQDDGDQQLERRGIFQLGGWRRIGRLQAFEQGAALRGIHEAAGAGCDGVRRC